MRSSISGPAYGAKGELLSGSLTSTATSQTGLIIDRVAVPTGEDWYICQLQARAGTAGSDAATMDVLDDGATVLPSTVTVSTTGTSRITTASSGEDEGIRVASGSIVTVTITTGATTGAGNLNWHIFGFIRNVR